MGKKSKNPKKKSKSGEASVADSSTSTSASAPSAPSAPAPARTTGTGTLLPHHATSIDCKQFNQGVPCWTRDELISMPRDSWPPCTNCGKPDSSMLCPKCAEWNLPLEVYCGRACLEQQASDHVERLHIPEGEWVVSKRFIEKNTTGEQKETLLRVMEATAQLYVHPRQRNERRQSLGQQGRQWVQQATALGYPPASNRDDDDDDGVEID